MIVKINKILSFYNWVGNQWCTNLLYMNRANGEISRENEPIVSNILVVLVKSETNNFTRIFQMITFDYEDNCKHLI